MGFWDIFPNDSIDGDSSPWSSSSNREVSHTCSGGLARGSVKASLAGVTSDG